MCWVRGVVGPSNSAAGWAEFNFRWQGTNFSRREATQACIPLVPQIGGALFEGGQTELNEQSARGL